MSLSLLNLNELPAESPEGAIPAPTRLQTPADPREALRDIVRAELKALLMQTATPAVEAAPEPPPAKAPRERVHIHRTKSECQEILNGILYDMCIYAVNNDQQKAFDLARQWVGAARAMGLPWVGRNPLDQWIKAGAEGTLRDVFHQTPADVRFGNKRGARKPEGNRGEE